MNMGQDEVGEGIDAEKKAVGLKIANGLGIDSNSRQHVSGRYVNDEVSPSFLVATLSETAASVTVYSWGFWPLPGFEAEFQVAESLTWVKGLNVTHRHAMEEYYSISYFGEKQRLELQFTQFPESAEKAAEILGSMLNLEIYDASVHVFGEEIVDDLEDFEHEWKKLSNLKPVNFIERSFKVPGNGIECGPNDAGDLTIFEVTEDVGTHCMGFSIQNLPTDSPNYTTHEGRYFIDKGQMAVAHTVHVDSIDYVEISCIGCSIRAGVIQGEVIRHR